jgi:outer membrane protein TolC
MDRKRQSKGGMMPKRLLTLGLIGCIGCAGGPDAGRIHEGAGSPIDVPVVVAQSRSPAKQAEELPNSTGAVTASTGAVTAGGDLLIEAKPAEDAFSLVDFILDDESMVDADRADKGAVVEPVASAVSQPETVESRSEQVDLNLPSALAMVGGQHPIVGFARWRVQEAYAELAQAEALWLPSIQAGFSFNRHDGNLQASNGAITDVNRNSFQYGLGAGAVGAGTSQRPGLVAQFHLADAIFQPKVAQSTVWARGHAASATLNQQMLSAALAYTELVRAYQDVSILEASKSLTEELAKITRDFAEAGQGLQADAERVQTELALVENRLIAAGEQTEVASARLAQAISLDDYRQIVPLDVTVVPLEMVPMEDDKATLIGTGLTMRPELKESQALVAAACQAYNREKYAPFVPSVLLGFSTGGFGGGLGNHLDQVDGRYDIDALMTWQVRNMGLGEKAARRQQCARVQQAKFERIQMMDQVARQVSEGYAQVLSRSRQISATERAIGFAEKSYDRDLKRIRDGEGLPLEVLQSLRALEDARRAYLAAVVDHNQAQFRLQWAQGWPVEASPR